MSNHRLRCVGCLLTPAPFRWWIFGRMKQPEVSRCYVRAMGLTLLLQLLLAGFVVVFAALTATIYLPSTDRLLRASNQILPVVGVGLVAGWLVVWSIAVVLAALGSARTIPVVARLGATPRRRRFAAVIAAMGGLVGLVIFGIALHSTTLARELDGRPARVYVLYDRHAVNLGETPRWVLTLASYRISRAARQRWGTGNVVVDRVSPASLRQAFRYGEVVILATHGRSGEVHYDNGKVFTAKQLGTRVLCGPRLKLVYFTACGGGYALDDWRRGLRPARVISFARNTSTSEHAWWFWSGAPRMIRQLK